KKTPRYPTPADVDTVLNYMVAHYRINKARIYITGLSYSGGLSWAYGGVNTIYSNRVAAIVPVAGSFPPDGNTDIAARSRVMASTNLPVFATHNKGDYDVPVSVTLSYISKINTAPAPTPLAKDTIFNVGGHDAWTKSYDLAFKFNNLNIYQWMLQYSRTKVYAASNSPVCPGTTLNLAAFDTTGATYKWTGPNGFTSTSRTPSIANASSATVGTYTVTITRGGRSTNVSTVVKLTTSKTYYKDGDADGYGTRATKKIATCRPAGYVSDSLDCNDANNKVYPGAWELCDGLDNDCDGVVDDGQTLKTLYQDLDKDGYGNPSVTKVACAFTGYVTKSGDCNDNNAAIKPGAAEVAGNGVDDDCDGLIDETTTMAVRTTNEVLEEPLRVAVSPNPTINDFTMHINSGSNSPVQLRVLDVAGRVIDVKRGQPAQQTLRLGQSYKPGVYYAEVVQGTEKILVKLVKH
ncbi:MAG TPA: MopE-related protein, partial [Niastella sp.]|nr:MopE-related protein [Niastella sp.]